MRNWLKRRIECQSKTTKNNPKIVSDKKIQHEISLKMSFIDTAFPVCFTQSPVEIEHSFSPQQTAVVDRLISAGSLLVSDGFTESN